MIVTSKGVVKTWVKKDESGNDILALEESDGFRKGDNWDQRTQKTGATMQSRHPNDRKPETQIWNAGQKILQVVCKQSGKHPEAHTRRLQAFTNERYAH